jgi:hypothetical protein
MPATATDLGWPGGVAVTASGRLVVASTASNVVIERSADGTTAIVAGLSAMPKRAPQVQASGFRVYLSSAKTRSGCTARISYTTTHDAKGKLTIANRSWNVSIFTPGNRVGVLLKLKPRRYAVKLTAKRIGDGRDTTATATVDVRKGRCGA